MKASRFFPRRLFLWSLSRQCLSLIVVFAMVAVFSWFALDRAPFSPLSVFLSALGVGLIAALGIQLVLLRRLLIPLGRLIEKTRSLREFPFDVEAANPEFDFGEDDPGEWSELDRALNQLGQSLRRKTIDLSREKTQVRALMSSVSEAVLAVSKDREVLFYNPQLALLFNLQGEMQSQRISSVLRQPDVLEAYEKSLVTGAPLRVAVNLLEESSGHRRDFLLSVAPLLKKHNQEVYGAVGIFYDVTELKAAERLRIEFIGNASHELRTPLTSVSGYLQTVIQDFEQGRMDEAKNFLGVIQNNVNRMKSLVNDLLDLSNLESGRDMKKEWVSVEEVTETALRQIPIKDRRLRVHVEVETVHAEFGRACQVLRNLLENAFRYVPKDKEISISWERGEGSEVLLRVKDDGPGIAKEHQARLFERFYRVDKSRARMDGGTGIGLSIVKHIMQRHGGFIELKSESGKGAEFICHFPS